MNIFFSYSKEDFNNFKIAEVVSKLEELPKIDHIYYWDRDSDSSQTIIEYMERAIHISDIFIVFCTKTSMNSKPVNQEIDMAVYLGKRIIPVFEKFKDVRLSLQPKRGVKFKDENFAGFISELYTIITGHKPDLQVTEEEGNLIIQQLVYFHGIQMFQRERNNIDALEQIIGKIPIVSEIKYNTFGIVIDDYQVTQLGLYNGELSELPEPIFQFKNLQLLSLFKNNFTSLPDSIDELKSLKELRINSNQISSLPNSIGKLLSLQKFDIDNNRLETIPEEIGQLINLRELDLSWNLLKSIPDSIGNLISLKFFWINDNNLEILPDTIGQLKNMKILNFYNNQIKRLPERIEQMLKNLKKNGCNIVK